MGGKIWVTSEYGMGSTFSFYIIAKEHINIEIDLNKYKNVLKGKCALIVDDVDANRMMLSSMLLKWNMIPITCGSAKEALVYLKSGSIKFDLALLDIYMPGTNGIQLANKIKKMNIDIPLIALSSIGAEEKGNNFDIFLHKPIKEKYLLRAIVNVLTGKQLGLCTRSNSISVVTQKLHDDVSIIIADDVYINRKVIAKIFNKMGYKNIDTVNNGKELLDKLNNNYKYDLILLDIRMPILNGMEAAKLIQKKYNDYGKPYVVALTASIMQQDKAKYIEDGKFNDFLFKPSENHDFEKILKDVVKHKKNK